MKGIKIMASLKVRIFKGDTLKGIADTIGVPVFVLQNLNPQIKNINKIFVGQLISIPDTENTRGFAAGRQVAWNAIHGNNVPNTRGDWGAYSKTPVVQLPNITNPPDTIVDEFGNPPAVSKPSVFSNPWVIGGIGVVLIALFMGKKGR